MNSRYIPDRKVLAGGLGGLLTWLVLLALEHFFGIVISSDVAALIVAIVAPSISYAVPPSVQDIAKRLDRDIRSVFIDRQSDIGL